ncbi:hypothetical protein DH2020_010868 [Rehmannia glutinosa]|uniref:Reverse transcriptase Ty1/copia-type domain-containing protein n=1 Tax=Rehmannia glutinosa TaxID=99300 RepID=A0ABR0XBY8_REHGL
MFSLAVSRGWLIQQVDINNAFLNGSLQQVVYMAQPEGFVHPDKPHHVCKLVKALYGLKQDPRAWFEKLKDFLLSLHFHVSTSDNSLFFLQTNGKLILLLVYVDDILITGDDSAFVLELISKLNATFALKHLGQVSYFLGLEAHKISGGYLLNQPKYISDILAKTNMTDCKPSPTPFCSGQKLSLGDNTSFSLPSLYRITVGSLQYLTMTRPDIAYAVHKLSQFLQAPTENHWTACKKILRYLKGSRFLGIKFVASPRMNLEAFVDADWASSCDDRKSISGYCVFLGPNLISWCSKKQQVVARSSTEAEYRSMAVATTDLIWIQSLFDELGLHIESPTVLWCDNSSAISLASNPVFHQRTKHIEIDIHFIREKVRDKIIDIHFVPSESQITDVLTKPLSLARFQFLCSRLSLVTARFKGAY